MSTFQESEIKFSGASRAEVEERFCKLAQGKPRRGYRQQGHEAIIVRHGRFCIDCEVQDLAKGARVSAESLSDREMPALMARAREKPQFLGSVAY